jgi:hypothetical protein
MFRRVAVFAFGVVSYAVFLAPSSTRLAFVGGFLVPTTLDGAPRLPFAGALAIDLGLLTLFALQHSVMARPAFKRAWTVWCRSRWSGPSTCWPRAVPDRDVRLLAAAGRNRLAGRIPVGKAIAYALFAFGWGLVLVTTFLINHFDLFGLRQVWLHLLAGPTGACTSWSPAPTSSCVTRSTWAGCSRSGPRPHGRVLTSSSQS